MRIALVLTAQLAQTLNRSELSRRVRQFRLRGCVFEVRTRVLQRFFRTLACIFSLFSFDAHRTRTNPRDERRVARQNAEFTCFARQRDELRLAREDLLFRADDVYFNGCHKCRLLSTRASVSRSLSSHARLG